MNTYNDNLRATVVDSLRQQELNLANISAQQNASMFTMFYAQSTVMTDAETLLLAGEELTEKANLKFHGVNNATISTNQLAAAQQSSVYMTASQSNSAVCAANVTATANAILKLAGDVGGIYSNLQASLRDSNLFEQGQEAYDLINISAQLAEHSSEVAMNASSTIAEVASSAVLDLSKATNKNMQDLLKTLNLDFAASTAVTETDNDTLAAAKIAEQAADGNFVDLYIDYLAADSAYKVMNTELNMDLQATISNNDIGDPTLKISFDILEDPFVDSDVPTSMINGVALRYKTICHLPAQHGMENYPVKSYHLFFVKNTEKFTFSSQVAESVIQNTNPNNYTNYTINFDTSSEIAKHNHSNVIFGTKKGAVITLDPLLMLTETGKSVYNDVDGDSIESSKNYVVFIMANYADVYKKRLNDFSDFLSAPSAPFLPAIQLPVAQVTSANTERIEFTCPEIKDAATDNIQLRAMLLPYTIEGIDSLLPLPDYSSLPFVTAALNSDVPHFQAIPHLHFTFNTQLACGVEAGNYILVVPPKPIHNDQSEAVQAKRSKNSKSDIPGRPSKSYSIPIDENTTDIFGDPLDFRNTTYLVTILTISEVEVNNKYLPALALDAPSTENTITNLSK